MQYNITMYTNILAHKKYMQNQLAKDLPAPERKQLYHYHLARVRDFQHERLIHLLVTFFFAFLLIGSVVAWVSLSVTVPQLGWPLGAQVLLLFVLTCAYVWHYYHLENGVQSLYDITEQFKI